MVYSYINDLLYFNNLNQDQILLLLLAIIIIGINEILLKFLFYCYNNEMFNYIFYVNFSNFVY